LEQTRLRLGGTRREKPSLVWVLGYSRARVAGPGRLSNCLSLDKIAIIEGVVNMKTQDQYFKAVTERNLVRTSVRAIIIKDNQLLVQRPSDDPKSCYGFIGGEYEHGDTIESRMKLEIEEETNAKITNWQYLFIVENKFQWNGKLFHGLELYLDVEIDRKEIVRREKHLVQRWFDINELQRVDIRPKIVKECIMNDTYKEQKHLIVPHKSNTKLLNSPDLHW
jgi:ADP-ribose pyrophosphatase YjhB (NUDIX family)